MDYFPEYFLAKWLRKEGIEASIYTFERTGVSPVPAPLSPAGISRVAWPANAKTENGEAVFDRGVPALLDHLTRLLWRRRPSARLVPEARGQARNRHDYPRVRPVPPLRRPPPPRPRRLAASEKILTPLLTATAARTR